MVEMIFLLIVSYSILIVLLIAFMVFAVKQRTEIMVLRDEIQGLRDDVRQTQELYRSEIRTLLDGWRGVVK